MTVIRYRKENSWLPWVLIAILVAVIAWLFMKVRKLEKRLWQAEHR